ncbi:hypothetical protein TNCV_1312061 [Trichonephila clavipes]|nr:hypothetical protein TNCV_1312061 [Trichonephila clavipes]
MKKHLQGRRFVSSHEVKVALQEFLREVAKNGFQLCLKLYERWWKCIVAQGDFFEGAVDYSDHVDDSSAMVSFSSNAGEDPWRKQPDQDGLIDSRLGLIQVSLLGRGER